jgi:hypothetical protein
MHEFIHINYSDLIRNENLDSLSYNELFLIFCTSEPFTDSAILTFQNKDELIIKINKHFIGKMILAAIGPQIEIKFIFIKIDDRYIKLKSELSKSIGYITYDKSVIEEVFIYKMALDSKKIDGFIYYYFYTIVEFMIGNPKNALKFLNSSIELLSPTEDSLKLYLSQIKDLLVIKKHKFKTEILVIYSCLYPQDQIEYQAIKRVQNILNLVYGHNILIEISNGSDHVKVCDLLKEYKDKIIFIIGHGSKESGIIINFNQVNETIKDNLNIENEVLSKFILSTNSNENQLFGLFCCYGEYYFNIKSSGNKNFKLIHAQNTISFQEFDPFFLGFLQSLSLGNNIYNSFLLGKFALSSRSSGFDNFIFQTI